MYTPPAYREEDMDILREHVRKFPLGTLITSHGGALEANLLPFFLASTPSGDILRTHISKANEQISALSATSEALVIFHGPNGYISPSWDPSKAQHGKVVPTWNYVVVQIWGKPLIMNDRDWLSAQIADLTTQQEHGRPAPWSVEDAPEPFIAAQIEGITGLEIPISRIEGKWKLSQNRPLTVRRALAAGLYSNGDAEMAKLVEPNKIEQK